MSSPTMVIKPGSDSRWNKATCLYCPATAFIRVPKDEETTVYVCPGCTVTKKTKEEQD